MNEKLVMAEARYDEISAKLSDPAVIADNKLYRDLMREHKNLTPLMEVWQKYKKAQRGFDDAVEALNEAGGDAELRELAQSEYDENKAAMEKLSEELKILLLPKDPDDDRSCIIEIRAGAGGEEAALFANSLLRMYSMYAARSSPRPARSRNGVPGAHTDLHRDGGGAPGGRGSRRGDKPRRPAHRNVPLKRRGRSAYQQDGIRDKNNPQADRDSCRVPGGAFPVQEQGKGDEEAVQQALRSEAGSPRQRHSRGTPHTGRHRRPLRADTHLQFPAVPRDRPPHRADAL